MFSVHTRYSGCILFRQLELIYVRDNLHFEVDNQCTELFIKMRTQLAMFKKLRLSSFVYPFCEED
jgi:hypothetical protein